MELTFQGDYPNRFLYKLEVSIDYPYPFESTPRQGIIRVMQIDELAQYHWKNFFTWNEFWPAVADRIEAEYDPQWQTGFDGWTEDQPSIGYDEQCGNVEVLIEVCLPYIHKFEDERGLAEVRLVISLSKKTGALLEWYV